MPTNHLRDVILLTEQWDQDIESRIKFAFKSGLDRGYIKSGTLSIVVSGWARKFLQLESAGAPQQIEGCGNCGLQGYSGWCRYCRSGEQIASIKMPYACKLLLQELLS